MTLIELVGTLASLTHLNDPQEETPYFALTIAGRTKMNRNQGAKVRIPCAGRTQGSGIDAGKWVKRHVSDLSACGRTSSYLCTKWGGGGGIPPGGSPRGFLLALGGVGKAAVAMASPALVTSGRSMESGDPPQRSHSPRHQHGSGQGPDPPHQPMAQGKSRTRQIGAHH